MAAATREPRSSALGYTTPRTSTLQMTCSICKRFLYSFEEVLRCRICRDSCHARCVESKTGIGYRANDDFICDYCSTGRVKPSSFHRNHPTVDSKSTDTIDEDDNEREMSVSTAIQYFEKLKPKFPPVKRSQQASLDGYLPSTTTTTEADGHREDDSEAARRKPPRRFNKIRKDDDDDEDASGGFQVEYEYTTLKDYAAKSNEPTASINEDDDDDENQNSSPYQLPPSRYGGGLQYSNHGYDPTVSHVIEAPLSASTEALAPIMVQPRKHFFSATSLKLDDDSLSNPLTAYPLRSNPYPPSRTTNLSDDGSQAGGAARAANSNQLDDGSDSGNRMTGVVRRMNEQLDADAQKLNEKLEARIQDLEKKIGDQAQIIERQGAVIGQLRGKISTTGDTRVQTSEDETSKTSESIAPMPRRNQPAGLSTSSTAASQLAAKAHSNSTTSTDTSKSSSKKHPAPRPVVPRATTNSNGGSASNATRSRASVHGSASSSSSSSNPALSGILPPARTSIRGSMPPSTLPNNVTNRTTANGLGREWSSNYNVAQIRQKDRSSAIEPVSRTQQQVTTSVHHGSSDDIARKDSIQPARSLSTTSSSDRSMPSAAKRVNPAVTQQPKPARVVEPPPSVAANSSTTRMSRASDLGPIPSASPGAAYTSPARATPSTEEPADVTMEGWFRKQNRGSFFKRVEEFYGVLVDNVLVLQRNEDENSVVKEVHLQGARVRYNNDPKYGDTVELTYTAHGNENKTYHLYVESRAEADQWVDAIQTAVNNLKANRRPRSSQRS